MIKSTYLLLLFCGFSQIAMAQNQRAHIGLGASFSHFQWKDNVTLLTSQTKALPHFQYSFETYDKLSRGYRGNVQMNFYKKEIRLGTSYRDGNSKVKYGFAHEYLSSDIVLSVSYDFRKGYYIFKPRLGYFFSFNHYIGSTVYSQNTGGTGQSQISFGAIEVEDASNLFYPGILAGFSLYNSKIAQRNIALFADFYFTPTDIFNDSLRFSVDGFLLELQGKLHHLNVGCRVSLIRF